MKQGFDEMVYEEILYERLLPFLRGKFRYVAWQVSIPHSRIDLVAFSTRKNVYAIEVSTRDWIRGFKQALKNSLYADFVYVALPRSVVEGSIRKRNLYKETGVGLISIGTSVEIVVKAQRSMIRSNRLKNDVLKVLMRKRKRLYALRSRIEESSSQECLSPSSDRRCNISEKNRGEISI
jgi:hypothetical protein